MQFYDGVHRANSLLIGFIFLALTWGSTIRAQELGIHVGKFTFHPGFSFYYSRFSQKIGLFEPEPLYRSFYSPGLAFIGDFTYFYLSGMTILKDFGGDNNAGWVCETQVILVDTNLKILPYMSLKRDPDDKSEELMAESETLIFKGGVRGQFEWGRLKLNGEYEFEDASKQFLNYTHENDSHRGSLTWRNEGKKEVSSALSYAHATGNLVYDSGYTVENDYQSMTGALFVGPFWNTVVGGGLQYEEMVGSLSGNDTIWSPFIDLLVMVAKNWEVKLRVSYPGFNKSDEDSIQYKVNASAKYIGSKKTAVKLSFFQGQSLNSVSEFYWNRTVMLDFSKLKILGRYNFRTGLSYEYSRPEYAKELEGGGTYFSMDVLLIRFITLEARYEYHKIVNFFDLGTRTTYDMETAFVAFDLKAVY